MSKRKQWSEADRALAINWIESRAKSAIFLSQQQEIEKMLAALVTEEDPVAFGVNVKRVMEGGAYQRMLASLRQAKHSGTQTRGLAL